MRGSGGGYGFDFIRAIGADRENAVKAQDKDKIKISVEKLEDLLSRVHILYY